MIQLLPFALALTIGATAATPAIAPGTYNYTASVNGAAVGTDVITVSADGTNTVIGEKGTGSAQGQTGSAAATLTLGSDLAPTAYQLDGTLGAQAVKSTATFAGSKATVTGMTGTKSFDLLGSTKHFVVVDFGVIAGFVAMPAQLASWGSDPVLAIVPSYGISTPLAPDATLKPTRSATVAASDSALSFGGQVPLTIWYNPTTYITDEIDVPSQGLSVVRK